jgi:RNA polymerase sigma-70 factor (ECF subfamily)
MLQDNWDSDLVRQVVSGNSVAFDALFQRHKPFVYNVCYRMLGNADDAVDATQSTFIKAYDSIRKFRGDASFRTWLYRIAVNMCTEALRRESRRRGLLANTPDPAIDDDEPNDGVWEAMLELNSDTRALLVLFYFQELSGSEVAQVMQCSEGAVRVRLHRARMLFKKKYEELGYELQAADENPAGVDFGRTQ